MPGTRRRVPRAELEFSPDADITLERLVTARLLTADGMRSSSPHEALISAWPRFHGWVDRDGERIHHHRPLTEASQSWEELGRDPGALY
ncbi:hypothetical protein [Streptomyces albipurpureus]|uniref:Novel STAND NTPase 1 domain-containing protein n=1 Tax=Streptomyces albipurpureus TaxID=2897419 RepID=A0ABT0UGM3_9ACTN|nr:hypothetical protein [Streptomyces sp. CWNU-1]MCM2387451.1 hypothetical protein [Streptomyces sp. CWNU-1]